MVVPWRKTRGRPKGLLWLRGGRSLLYPIVNSEVCWLTPRCDDGLRGVMIDSAVWWLTPLSDDWIRSVIIESAVWLTPRCGDWLRCLVISVWWLTPYFFFFYLNRLQHVHCHKTNLKPRKTIESGADATVYIRLLFTYVYLARKPDRLSFYA